MHRNLKLHDFICRNNNNKKLEWRVELSSSRGRVVYDKFFWSKVAEYRHSYRDRGMHLNAFKCE